MDQPTTPPTPDAAQKPPVNDVEINKDIAALSYAWVLSVVVFFWKKDSPFAQFHAKQGMVLFALSIIFTLIPFVGRYLNLLILMLCVLGFISAAQGQWKGIPIIGDIASGQWSHVRQSWRDVISAIVQLWNRLFHSDKKEHATSSKDTQTPLSAGSEKAANVASSSDVSSNPSSKPESMMSDSNKVIEPAIVLPPLLDESQPEGSSTSSVSSIMQSPDSSSSPSDSSNPQNL